MRRTLLPPAIPNRIGTSHELWKYAPFVTAEVHLHARQKGNLESPLRLTCRTIPILADTSASAGNSIAFWIPMSMFPIPMFIPEKSWVSPGEGTGGTQRTSQGAAWGQSNCRLSAGRQLTLGVPLLAAASSLIDDLRSPSVTLQQSAPSLPRDLPKVLLHERLSASGLLFTRAERLLAKKKNGGRFSSRPLRLAQEKKGIEKDVRELGSRARQVLVSDCALCNSATAVTVL